MEIRAKSKFDLESLKAFTRFLLFKKNDPKKRFVLWTSILAGLSLIMALELIVSRDPFWILLLFVAALTVLLECYFYFALPKIRYNLLANFKETENEYVFCDNVLKIYTKNKEYNGSAEIEYSALVKGFETSRYFFLYQTKNQVFMVDKSTVEGGSAEEIRNKLFEFMQNKLVICEY